MPARGRLTLFHIRGIRIGVDYSWFLVLFLVIFWLSVFVSHAARLSELCSGPSGQRAHNWVDSVDPT